MVRLAAGLASLPNTFDQSLAMSAVGLACLLAFALVVECFFIGAARGGVWGFGLGHRFGVEPNLASHVDAVRRYTHDDMSLGR